VDDQNLGCGTDLPMCSSGDDDSDDDDFINEGKEVLNQSDKLRRAAESRS